MTDKDLYAIPSAVASYMDKFGCNHAEFITSNMDGDVYALSYLDVFGNISPVGLPIFIILKKEKTSVISGIEALEYQRLLNHID